MKRTAILLALALVALNAAAQKMPSGTKASYEPGLIQVKKAAEKYRDVNVALAEGYLRDPMNLCDTASMMGRSAEFGAMGIHFFRPDLLGITGTTPRVNGNGTHTDFLKPAILIYEPQADGSLALVAVENLVFKKAWHEKNDAPPTYYGVPWDSMQDDPATEVDEAHHFEPHYDRHVWLFRDNPNGIFSPFNPNVSCEHHKQEAAPMKAADAKMH